jgi:ABC-type antimicrobial peptide transport system permease subunit
VAVYALRWSMDSLSRGVALALVGLTVGLGGARALTRALSGLLCHVAPHDPMSFAGVALLFTIIAAVACWLPARAAMRVQPATALRTE